MESPYRDKLSKLLNPSSGEKSVTLVLLRVNGS